MSEEIKKRVKTLVAQRGQIQAKITRFLKLLEQGGEYVDVDYATDCFDKIETAISGLDEIQVELISCDTTVDHEEAGEELIYKFHQAKALFKRLSNPTPPVSANNAVATINSNNSISKLPKLELKTFDGTLEKWRGYRDWFRENIHKRDCSDSTKLEFLQNTLRGEAAQTIEAFEATNNNYTEAWKLLEETYDIEYILVFRHLDLLLETSPMKHNSAEEIRKLLNRVQTQLLAMKALGEKIEQWNTIVVHLIIKRLHKDTAREWNRRMKNSKMPKSEDLIAFLREEATRLVAVTPSSNFNSTSKHQNNNTNGGKNASSKSNRSAFVSSTDTKCPKCQGDHSIVKCNAFLNLTIPDRFKCAKASTLCLRCLLPGHKTRLCKAAVCHTCQKGHHSLVHLSDEDWKIIKSDSRQLPQVSAQVYPIETPAKPNISTVLVTSGPAVDLLTTAVVEVLDKNGVPFRCRALLDTCSSSNFMTTRFAKKLGIPLKKCEVNVIAIGDTSTITKSLLNAKFKSRINNYTQSLSFLTVNNIGGLQPPEPVDTSHFKIPKGIKLADPEYFRPQEIDILLSSGPTLSLLSVGQIQGIHPKHPNVILQKTKLGWIIGGSVSDNSKENINVNCKATNLDFNLNKFWELEEVTSIAPPSSEENACEEFFSRTCTRDKDGRYVLALPFKENVLPPGNSRTTAEKRLKGILRKMQRDPEFKKQYTAAMQEYIDRGYMTEIEDPGDSSDGFFLPHHAVIKETSTTTKRRIVFDGSAKSSSGISLNEQLMTGPILQDSLFLSLIRFRIYKFVITGDIEKMYLQFGIRPEDRKYLRILWINSNGVIKVYEFNVLIFGLTPASFLAIRGIHQLAYDEGQKFPLAALTLLKKLYVDDAIDGSETIEEGLEKRDQLRQLLSLGGLKIRQWASNDSRLLEGLPPEDVKQKLSIDDNTIKTLGLQWDASEDIIEYKISEPHISEKVTKRTILSNVAKIFDPLGLLSPVIVKAKLIMQQLWDDKVSWDESVPLKTHTEWLTYCRELHLLNVMQFERRSVLTDSVVNQLHGFCDASTKAYGACIYLRSEDNEGRIKVVLLCAKSRVAPLKTVSLPRLELCGAQLLSQLYNSIQGTLDIKIHQTIFWSDSTIVLHWINTPPHLLQTFVGNRITEIQTKTNAQHWRHVRSEDNPADAISRGQLPSELIKNNMWMHGPRWLHISQDSWPILEIKISKEIPEMRKASCFVTSKPSEYLTLFSSLSKLRKLFAYGFRFKRDNRNKGVLTVDELNAATLRIMKLVQMNSFSEELHLLKNNKELNQNSPIKSLSPIIDNEGLLRVGGRLRHSNIPESQKYPILLPKNHHVTKLVIHEEHTRNYHSGTQSTLYAIRQKYWIVHGRSQVRQEISKCVTCFKCKPVLAQFKMGDLPEDRVTSQDVFYNTGVDYCGPFYVKQKKLYNRVKVKIYVVVFVCLWSKAIHLEISEDLTTDAFIGALSRFIDRRGRCKNLYSDNGTNFVGANNQLKELYGVLNDEASVNQIQYSLAQEGINWHFIPPLSPHWGGLWEAGVKSMKYHMCRVVGEKLCTIIEFQTFLTRIEAILNSRPISYISCDPNDPIPMTPGHFLIGKSIMSITEEDNRSVPINRLSNWEYVTRMKRDFWDRWHKEYISSLNVRHKWSSGRHSIDVGSVVLLKDDNLPPLQWSLGKVVKVHSGKDKIPRVVDVRVGQRVHTRNIRSLAPLPNIKNDCDNVINSVVQGVITSPN